MNDSAFTPYSTAPNEISPHTRDTLLTHPAAPLCRLHNNCTGRRRRLVLQGVVRKDRDRTKTDYTLRSRLHLSAPCWVAPGVTQDSRSSWQTSQYGHNDARMVSDGSLALATHS